MAAERIFVALDLEMTGHDPEQDEIIQIGAVKFTQTRVLGRWGTLVRPKVKLPFRIARLTGINPNDLNKAPAFDVVKDKLRSFVGDHPIVGHSIGNDLSFLAKQGLALDNPSLDTWELAMLLMPSLNAYSLQGVASALGVSIDNHHDALADAEITRQVFLGLLARLRRLNPKLVTQVIRLTDNVDWPMKMVFQTLYEEVWQSQAARPSGNIGSLLASKGITEEDITSNLLSEPPRPSPLQPKEVTEYLDESYIESIFSPGGELSKTFPGYEVRDQQIDMALEVVRSINNSKHLVVEAGTGTGKSLAYLIPSAIFALKNNQRVVISTDTINLQDQLYNKDIPAVRKLLGGKGKDLRVSLVKGRNNYLCLNRWERFLRSGINTPEEAKFAVKVLLWLQTTITGDVSELPLTSDEKQFWQRVSATEETCTTRVCRNRKGRQCFLFRARVEAESSHLVVVNHALLLSDLASNNSVLPNYDYLIIDEAHRLEDQATNHLGFEVDSRALHELLNRVMDNSNPIRPEGISARLPVHMQGSRASNASVEQVTNIAMRLAQRTERTRARVDEFFASLGRLLPASMGLQNGYDEHLRLTAEVRGGEQWEGVLLAWENLKLTLRELVDEVHHCGELLEGLEGLHIAEYEELLAEVQAIEVSLQDYIHEMNSIIMAPTENDVTWISYSHRYGTITLHKAPLDVGGILQEELYSKKKAVILTSATLTTDRNFDYVTGRLGLYEFQQLMLGSPFDYQNTALLLVPTDIPEPGTAGYQDAVESLVAELVLAAEGRTMVLFTSHSAVQATQKAIYRELARHDILVLSQGEGSRHRLLQQFKSNPRTVLLGTRSFWEGVDVVGDALSLLIIAKLPFEVPNEPVFVARSETFADAFNDYAIPQAILRLKQGFGRLIRSKTDRGVVVILDKRVLTKRYGVKFLTSLPNCKMQKGPARLLAPEVKRWLGQNSEERLSVSRS